MNNLYNLYSDVVDYATHLEDIIKGYGILDDEALKDIRKQYLKPATNVAKDLLEGGTK